CSAPLPERKVWQSPSRFGLAAGLTPTGPSLPPGAPPAHNPPRGAPPVPVTGAGRGPVRVEAGGSPPPVARMVRATSRTGPGRWPLAKAAAPPVARAPVTITTPSPVRRRRRALAAGRGAVVAGGRVRATARSSARTAA